MVNSRYLIDQRILLRCKHFGWPALLLDGPQGDKVVLYYGEKCTLIGSIHQIVILWQVHQHRPFADCCLFIVLTCGRPCVCLSAIKGHISLRRCIECIPSPTQGLGVHVAVDDKTEEFSAGCPHYSPLLHVPLSIKGHLSHFLSHHKHLVNLFPKSNFV